MQAPQKKILAFRQVADTRIDFETSLEGKIGFNGVFVLDGVLNGDLKGKDYEKTTAVVSSRGKISGNIDCTNAIIAGTVIGDIRAHTLELHESAKVLGDMYYDTLQVDPKAEINGKFIPQEARASKADDAKTGKESSAVLSKAVNMLRW